MAKSIIVQAGRILVVDLIGGAIGFPFWWYSKGLVRWTRFVWQWYTDYAAYLGVTVWVKNLFVPMYGSYDIPGRIISFFMRLVVIAARSVGMILLTILMIVIYLAYFVLPIAVVGMIVYNATVLLG